MNAPQDEQKAWPPPSPVRDVIEKGTWGLWIEQAGMRCLFAQSDTDTLRPAWSLRRSRLLTLARVSQLRGCCCPRGSTAPTGLWHHRGRHNSRLERPYPSAYKHLALNTGQRPIQCCEAEPWEKPAAQRAWHSLAVSHQPPGYLPRPTASSVSVGLGAATSILISHTTVLQAETKAC